MSHFKVILVEPIRAALSKRAGTRLRTLCRASALRNEPAKIGKARILAYFVAGFIPPNPIDLRENRLLKMGIFRNGASLNAGAKTRRVPAV